MSKGKLEQALGKVFGPAVEAPELRSTASLAPYARNARTHSPEQVDQIVLSMETYGWTNPVLVDPDGGIIAGHGRVLAAQKLGWAEVPCLVARGWSDEQKRLYVIADNQLALTADWDEELLALELGELRAAGLDLSLTGFDADALAAMLDPPPERGDPEYVPEVPVVPKSRIGDLYLLGSHRMSSAPGIRRQGEELVPDEPGAGRRHDDAAWRSQTGVHVARRLHGSIQAAFAEPARERVRIWQRAGRDKGRSREHHSRVRIDHHREWRDHVEGVKDQARARLMAFAHRHADSRACGATTIVTAQSRVPIMATFFDCPGAGTRRSAPRLAQARAR